MRVQALRMEEGFLMTKQELAAMVAAYKTQTREAIETILGELNQGQRKKILKSEAVAALCERFGVRTD